MFEHRSVKLSHTFCIANPCHLKHKKPKHKIQQQKQVFLLTNSLWDYTHVVMNFLSGKAKREERTTEWLDLFDVVIVGACKVSVFACRFGWHALRCCCIVSSIARR